MNSKIALFACLTLLTACSSKSLPSDQGESAGSYLPQSQEHPALAFARSGSETSGITEEAFDALMDQVESTMGRAAEGLGGRLTISRLWDDETVNADAMRSGSRWEVRVMGGIVRTPTMTPDALVLVACHEAGHLLAGFPFVPEEDAIAVEGQSDYFSTKDCAYQMWGHDTAVNHESAANVSPGGKAKCDAAWGDLARRELCYRLVNAAVASGRTLAAMDGNRTAPGISTPDRTAVDETGVEHPAAQCRFDTLIAGSLCEQLDDFSLIPGARELKAAQSLKAMETAASPYACAQGTAAGRPTCWFRSSLNGPVVDPGPTPNPEPNPHPDPDTAGIELTTFEVSDDAGAPISSARPGQTIYVHMNFRNTSGVAITLTKTFVSIPDTNAHGVDNGHYVLADGATVDSDVSFVVPRISASTTDVYIDLMTEDGAFNFTRTLNIR